MSLLGNIGKVIASAVETQNLQRMADRFTKDDGRVGANEAQALIREATKDGKVSDAEMKWLESKSRAGFFGLSSFTPAARETLRQFTAPSAGQAETSTSSVSNLQSMRDTFLADDGVIDQGEAKVILGEAMSSGRELAGDEVQFLRALASNPRTTPGAKLTLLDTLKYFPQASASPAPSNPFGYPDGYKSI